MDWYIFHAGYRPTDDLNPPALDRRDTMPSNNAADRRHRMELVFWALAAIAGVAYAYII